MQRVNCSKAIFSSVESIWVWCNCTCGITTSTFTAAKKNCVTGSGHTWKCFLLAEDSSNEGWRFLGILLLSYRKRQTNLVWKSLSQEHLCIRRQLSDTIHSSSRMEWIRTGDIHSPRPREQFDCTRLACFSHNLVFSRRNTNWRVSLREKDAN